MPVLDLKIQRTGYDLNVPQVRSTPDTYGAQGFRALADLGKQWQRMGADIARGRQEAEADSIVSKLTIDLDETNRTIQADADHTNYLPQFNDAMAKLTRDASDQVKASIRP